VRSPVKILDRYLFSQFTGPFLMATGGFLIIGIIDILFALVDLVFQSGVSSAVVFRLLLYKVPAIAVLFMPMSVLFAAMLLLVRMAKDSELTVLRASGIHLFRIIGPVIFFAMISASLAYVTNEKVVPWANQISDNLILREIEKKPPPTVVENVFFKDADERFFYIKKVDSKANVMDTVMVYELTDTLPRITTATSARWNGKTWILENGTIQEFENDGTMKYSSRFAELRIHVENSVEGFYTENKTPRQMDSRELRNKITDLKQSGANTRELKVEYQLKFAEPVACFVFGLVGIAYCLSFVRSGKDWWGVIFAVCFSVLTVGFYFFFVAVCRSMGINGLLDPIVAAWLPNATYTLVGSGLIFYHSFLR